MGSAFGIRLRSAGRRTCRRAAVLLRHRLSLRACRTRARCREGETDRQQVQSGVSLFIIVKPLRAAVAGGDEE